MTRAVTVVLAVATLAMLVTVPTVAATNADAWVGADKLEEALKLAAEKDVPVAVLYQFKDSSCPLHNGKVRSFINSQAFRNMIRVRVYTDEKSPLLQKVFGGHGGGFLPKLYITDGEDRLVGYLPYQCAAMDVGPVGGLVDAAMAWKRQARAALPKIEKHIEEKRFVDAQKQLVTLASQDQQLATKIAQSVEAQVFKEKNPSGAATRPDAAKPTPPKPATEGIFFAQKTKELTEKLKQAVEEELARIEGLLAEGKPRDAKIALVALAPYKADEATATRIKDLRAKADEAIKTGTSAPETKPEAPPAE